MTQPADFSQIASVISTLAEAGSRTKRGKDAIAPPKRAGAPIGETVGQGRASDDPAQTGGSGGIASPLTETDVGRRVYHDAQEIYTEDGTVVKVHPVKTMYMKDANGNEVRLDFGLPDYAAIVP